MTIHPKTSAAALGSALGLLIVAILDSIHGVHLVPEANAAIPSFLSVLGAWLAPGPNVTTVTGDKQEPVPPSQSPDTFPPAA